jgi:hypothetical protein
LGGFALGLIDLLLRPLARRLNERWWMRSADRGPDAVDDGAGI